MSCCNTSPCTPSTGNPCPSYPNTNCVVYSGGLLPCLGVFSNERLTDILEKIDAKLCAVPRQRYIFENALTESPDYTVHLGGSLIENTSITLSTHSLTVTADPGNSLVLSASGNIIFPRLPNTLNYILTTDSTGLVELVDPQTFFNPPIYTFVNGLSETGFVATLGGPLIHDTNIDFTSFNLSLSNVPIGSPVGALGLDVDGNIVVGSTEGGSVTDFTAGDLSPLFTTAVDTSTTTPALSFNLSNAAAGTYFGNRLGTSSAPAYYNLFTDVRLALSGGTGITYNNTTGVITGNETWQQTLDNGSTLNKDNHVDGGSFHFFWENMKHFINKTADVSETLNAKVNIGVATNDKALKITSSRNNAFFQIYDDNSPGNGGLDALNVKSFDKDGQLIFWLSGRWLEMWGASQPIQIYNGGITINNFGSTKSLVLQSNLIQSVADDLRFLTTADAFDVAEKARITTDGQLGIGTTTPNNSAIVDITSTTRGLLLPRMTTAQRDILTPANGTITVANFAALSGATVTVAGHVLTEGSDWTASGSNGATAASLASAIDALSEVSSLVSSGSIVFIQASSQGATGNSVTLATSDAVNLAKSGTTLSGGTNPALGLIIYNTSTNKANLYTGSWEQITSA